MSVLPIVIVPNPVLKLPSDKVTEFDEKLSKLIEDMFETMYAAPGVGLAAVQVGALQRVFVYDCSDDETQARGYIVNPEIVHKEGKIDSEEGCLSIPTYKDTITRAAYVVVKGQDKNGKEIMVEGRELLGRCLQHEIDHLDGILFTDHFSLLKRQMYEKWLKKQQTLPKQNL